MKAIFWRKRWLGSLVNFIFFIVPIIGWLLQLISVVSYRTTMGGRIVGYRCVNADDENPADVSTIIRYYFARWIIFLMYIISLTLLFWIDIANLRPRNGSFAEKWVGIVKVDELFEEYQNKTQELNLNIAAIKDKYRDTRTGDPVIEIRDFTKLFASSKQPIIFNASFKVYEGEIHALLGVNGAGKTTIIKSILNHYNDYDGTIELFGEGKENYDVKQDISYVPDEIQFPKNFTIKEYLKSMLIISGKKIPKSKVDEVIEKLGLNGISDKYLNHISLGQKKKVLLAQALLNDPKVIILDELLSSADHRSRLEILKVLLELKKQGVAVLMTTNIFDDLGRYADAMTVLDAGKVVYTGSVESLLKDKDWVYKIKLSKPSLAKKHLEEKGFKTWIADGANYVDFKTQKNAKEFQLWAAKNDIFIKNFAYNKMTMKRVFDKFVKYGSTNDVIYNDKYLKTSKDIEKEIIEESKMEKISIDQPKMKKMPIEQSTPKEVTIKRLVTEKTTITQPKITSESKDSTPKEVTNE